MFLAIALFGLSGIAAQAGPPYITAAINWPGGKAQFFLSDGTYVRYDVAADRADAEYPKPVTDSTWPGMGGYGRRIIAAVNGLDPNKVHFFLADGSYLRYDVRKDRVDEGYPQAVTNENWPGLAPHARRIYGAVNWAGNRLYFFLNDGTYLRYDLKADRMDSGYPKAVNHANWPGLAPYAKQLAGAINWENGKVYFFLDDGRYIRWDMAADCVDPGYPRPINSETWPGLHGYFRRKF